MRLTSISSLVATCVLMFVGSMLAGIWQLRPLRLASGVVAYCCCHHNSPAGLAPLFLTVSESQLQTISAVGAGLLIGTALGVILPEGSEAFRTAQEERGLQSELTNLRTFVTQPRLNTKHQATIHESMPITCAFSCRGRAAPTR